MLHIDRADDLIERGVGKVRRLADGCVVHFRPQQPEALALRQAPAGKARAHRILRADVDMDPVHLERARGFERKDSAVSALQLRVHPGRKTDDAKQQQEEDDKGTAQHSVGLLATTAWKSKRLVSSAPLD